MMPRVVNRFHHFKIFRRVVELVAVTMMNVLIRLNASTDNPFSDYSVQIPPSVCSVRLAFGKFQIPAR